MARLTPVTREMLREARRLRATPKVRLALVEAHGVEANYGNPDGGDRDSVGSLQERGHYGSRQRRLNPTLAARRFVTEAMKVRNKYGTAGQLAQGVQRSAFPERYDQRRGEARRLLRQFGGGGGGGGSLRRGAGGVEVRGARAGRYAAPVTTTDDSGALVDALLSGASRKGGLLKAYQARVDSGAYTTTTPGTYDPGDSGRVVPTKGKLERGPARGGAGGGGTGRFKISGPNPGRLNKGIVRFAEAVAGEFGKTITGSDGTGHSRNTVSGNLSQHTTGDATDIPSSGRELLRMGRAALVAAGMPRRQARKQRGGLYNVGGKQIIFLTNQGGNHFNHLHIGS